MTDSSKRTWVQVAKGMTIGDVANEKAKHVPWWKGKKYRYHTTDAVTGVKIRPGMKLAKLSCIHPNDSITMETYHELRKRTLPGTLVLCPMCRSPIKDQHFDNNIQNLLTSLIK